MWAVMCAYVTYLYSLWIFLSWLPSYLVAYRGFTLLKTGFLCLFAARGGRCRRCIRRMADRFHSG